MNLLAQNLLCLICLLLPLNAQAAKRVALVMGNANYQHSGELRNPLNDASDVEAALKNLGFHVLRVLDGNQEQMETAVAKFADDLRGAEIGLFYYAGHGVQVGNENYLLPIDMQVATAKQVRYKSLALGYVLAAMADANIPLSIAILDACRDNPFHAFRSLPRGLTRQDSPSGTLIAYATSPGKVAADGVGRNGVFTEHLLDHLDKPGLEAIQMFLEVGRAVKTATAGVQDPWLSLSSVPKFCFASCEIAPAPVKPTFPIPKMVRIPGGCYQMGSPKSEQGRYDDERQHRVCVGEFYIGQYEITFAEYDVFAETTGRKKPKDEGWGRGNRPVINVSWNDAMSYAKWLSEQTGERYRLPTEAEWEYAARGGTTTAYWWGDKASHEYTNYGKDECCNGLAQGRDQWINSAPVGSFPVNGYGLYDTAGNVWEWTCSGYDRNYGGGESRCLSQNNAGLPLLRGGSWDFYPRELRSAVRFNWDRAGVASSNVGFRLARIP